MLEKKTIIKIIEVRNCKHCGVELIKRVSESIARYMQKQYCSASCGRKQLKLEGKGFFAYKGQTETAETKAKRREEQEGRRKYEAMMRGMK